MINKKQQHLQDDDEEEEEYKDQVTKPKTKGKKITRTKECSWGSNAMMRRMIMNKK